MDGHESRRTRGRLPELDPAQRAAFERGLREMERLLEGRAPAVRAEPAPGTGGAAPARRAGTGDARRGASRRGLPAALCAACLLVALASLLFLTQIGIR